MVGLQQPLDLGWSHQYTLLGDLGHDILHRIFTKLGSSWKHIASLAAVQRMALRYRECHVGRALLGGLGTPVVRIPPQAAGVVFTRC
jgi:hypothetical protein